MMAGRNTAVSGVLSASSPTNAAFEGLAVGEGGPQPLLGNHARVRRSVGGKNHTGTVPLGCPRGKRQAHAPGGSHALKRVDDLGGIRSRSSGGGEAPEISGMQLSSGRTKC